MAQGWAGLLSRKISHNWKVKHLINAICKHVTTRWRETRHYRE